MRRQPTEAPRSQAGRSSPFPTVAAVRLSPFDLLALLPTAPRLGTETILKARSESCSAPQMQRRCGGGEGMKGTLTTLRRAALHERAAETRLHAAALSVGQLLLRQRRGCADRNEVHAGAGAGQARGRRRSRVPASPHSLSLSLPLPARALERSARAWHVPCPFLHVLSLLAALRFMRPVRRA